MENKECKYRLPCGWCDKKDKQCDFNNAAIEKQEETPATAKKANIAVPYRVPNDTELQTIDYPNSLYDGNHCKANIENLTSASASAKGEPSSSQTTKDDYPFTYTGKNHN